MSSLLLISSIVVFIFLLRYYWGRRHLYLIASQLPGPISLPVIGNGLTFMCTTEDMLKVITNMASKFPKPFRVWFGPLLIIYFTHPKHIEKILSSSKLTHKHFAFENILKIYGGDGLVSNSGEKHKQHRQLIQPLLNLKFVSANMETFQKHIDVLLLRLNEHTSKGTFDIHNYIHNAFADIIGETVLGTQMDAQNGKNLHFVKASTDMHQVLYERLVRPWLHPNIIYNLTSRKNDQDRIVNTTTAFIKDKTIRAWMRAKRDDELEVTTPIIDQIANIIHNNENSMNDTDFMYHMLTLYVASEDTMTIISAMLCVCLGMYPEYQKIAASEIRSVLGEHRREITYDDIIKLEYLDRCVRDVLRLIPIAPRIVRHTTGDFQIGNLTIPKDCGIIVSIFDVHRDPEYWENPHHFHPDHFLPEAVRKRHPYAYVPFSAGPRSCIGKVMAFIGLKLIMANILQLFEIEADGKFPDIVLKCDISVRSNSGYKVRLKRRIWSE